MALACLRCGAAFKRVSNRQRYCAAPECRKARDRDRKRKGYVRKTLPAELRPECCQQASVKNPRSPTCPQHKQWRKFAQTWRRQVRRRRDILTSLDELNSLREFTGGGRKGDGFSVRKSESRLPSEDFERGENRPP